MKLKPLFLSWLGASLFLTGVLMGLALSGGVLWGEIESSIYSSLSGSARLRVSCPLMLSPAESGTIRSDFTNPTDEEIKPVILAEITKKSGAQILSQTLYLAPGETQTIEWSVDASDVIFDKLILVSILQSQYRETPSRLGTCGVLFFGLFGLTGMQTFSLIFAASVICIFLGSGLWYHARKPLEKLALNVAQAGSLLAVTVVCGLFSSLPRWWGLTLILDGLSVLIMGIIVIEFLLFPQRYRD